MTKNLWIGLVDAQQSDSDKNGAGQGMFCNVLAPAATPSSFIRSIKLELDQLGYELVDLEEVELYEQRSKRYELTDEIRQLAVLARETERPQFTRFHKYPLDSQT